MLNFLFSFISNIASGFSLKIIMRLLALSAITVLLVMLISYKNSLKKQGAQEQALEQWSKSDELVRKANIIRHNYNGNDDKLLSPEQRSSEHISIVSGL